MNMTPQEAVREIMSTPKWYAIVEYGQSSLRYTAGRILSGKCKPDTTATFLAKFGYKIDIHVNVQKAS